jgi:hypothetical protein
MGRSKTDKNRAVKEMYAEFLRLPNAKAREARGIPPTKKAFSEAYRIDRTTMYHWEQDPEFRREVHNETLTALNVDEVERIKMALKVKAFDGNVPAAKLLLEWAGIYGRNASVPQDPADNSAERFENMTEEQLKSFLEQEDVDESFLYIAAEAGEDE